MWPEAFFFSYKLQLWLHYCAISWNITVVDDEVRNIEIMLYIVIPVSYLFSRRGRLERFNDLRITSSSTIMAVIYLYHPFVFVWLDRLGNTVTGLSLLEKQVTVNSEVSEINSSA